MAFWNKNKKKTDAPSDDEQLSAEGENGDEAGDAPVEVKEQSAAPVETSEEVTDEPKSGAGNKILKALLFLVALVVLIVVGFVAGVYLRVIDSNAASEQLKKHDIPVLGEYLAKIPLSPETKSADKADDEATKTPTVADKTTEQTDKSADKNDDKDKAADKDKDKDKNKDKKQSKTIKLTKEEIEKQTKEREAAEKKRVSKLARLYTNMKAKEAADALVNLDNNMIIAILQRMEEGQAAKILAQFEPERTAQITRIMFVGAQQRVTVPADLTENGEDVAGE